jgi:broad specificity phosphatase PhoE
MRPNPKDVLFYLGRHGTTTLNQEDRFRGPLNVDLDHQGRIDAEKLSSFFDRIKIGGIVTSDRNRAIETAFAIGDHRDLTPHIDPQLRSWNLGYLAGQKKDEHEDEVKDFVQNPDKPVPQGESLNQFRQRIHPIFAKAIQARQKTGIPHLLVAHASVVREASNVFNHDPDAALVKPGGAMAVMHSDNGIVAVPIFKPDPSGKDRYS